MLVCFSTSDRCGGCGVLFVVAAESAFSAIIEVVVCLYIEICIKLLW